MIRMIVIAAAAIIFLAGMIIVIAGTGSEKRKKGKSGEIAAGTGGREIVEGGVNTSNLHYGKGAGDDFLAGQMFYGTRVNKNGAVHRMWRVHFEFLGKGRKETVTFRSRMAIGRKMERMRAYPNLVIQDDRMVSSVHCYLIGTRGGLAIQDAQSLNHTYVNGKRVTGQAMIPNGAKIRVGGTDLKVTYEYH